MKHAYLIIAHSQFELLKILVTMLDHPLNDLFIHIDKKVVDVEGVMAMIRVKYSNLHFIKKRVDVRWGDISQIRCEYGLFREAFERGPYSYYHLLSGVDLPLKRQGEIHSFFNMHQGKEFVGFAEGTANEEDLIRKTRFYHILSRHSKERNRLLAFLINTIIRYSLNIQQAVGVSRSFDLRLKKGTQWVSVTHDFVSYLLENEKRVLQTFKYTLCPDEMFVQTLIWNSPFRNRVYSLEDELKGCVREIDWRRGSPYVWKGEDKGFLERSDKLFARKFDLKEIEIVSYLAEKGHPGIE